jgi:pseudouridine synthase
MKIILQKYIAEAGHCSRRQAEELIRAGKVKINRRLAGLGTRVDNNDEIKINGKMLGLAKPKIYIKLNKPNGYVCTSRRFKSEKNIFDFIKIRQRLFTVGRLDKDSRGLVLLTNDGDLTQKLAHPKFEHEKEYEVKIKNFSNSAGKQSKKIKKAEDIVGSLNKGVDIGEGDGVVKAEAIKFLGDNKFRIVLTQGKKRQIRRMFKAIGFEVKDLSRTRIGGLKLGSLKEGETELLKREEIKKILN